MAARAPSGFRARRLALLGLPATWPAILYNGDATTVRGVIANAETSAGEAGQPFGDFGPIAWLAYDGDPAEIEFVQYVEPATGTHLHRRATKRERVSSNYNTVKINLTVEATAMPTQRADFGPDFASEDFAT